MMDEFDESVDAAEGTERGGRWGLIGVLIGLAGIVIGITGIVLANQAQSRVKALEARLAAQPDKTPELQKSVADVNDRLEKLGSEFIKLGRTDRQIQDNTQAAFNEVTKNISANREAINGLSTKMTELVDKLENWKPSTRVATSTPAAGSTNAPETGAEAVPEEGVYLIQGGDTLSKIATRFGVSLSKLQAANPSVDPRRLQIGQRIIIPEP